MNRAINLRDNSVIHTPGDVPEEIRQIQLKWKNIPIQETVDDDGTRILAKINPETGTKQIWGYLD